MDVTFILIAFTLLLMEIASGKNLVIENIIQQTLPENNSKINVGCCYTVMLNITGCMPLRIRVSHLTMIVFLLVKCSWKLENNTLQTIENIIMKESKYLCISQTTEIDKYFENLSKKLNTPSFSDFLSFVRHCE